MGKQVVAHIPKRIKYDGRKGHPVEVISSVAEHGKSAVKDTGRNDRLPAGCFGY